MVNGTTSFIHTSRKCYLLTIPKGTHFFVPEDSAFSRQHLGGPGRGSLQGLHGRQSRFDQQLYFVVETETGGSPRRSIRAGMDLTPGANEPLQEFLRFLVPVPQLFQVFRSKL